MQELYDCNADFKRYVDCYCQSYRFSVEQALRHLIVRLVGQYYREQEESRICN